MKHSIRPRRSPSSLAAIACALSLAAVGGACAGSGSTRASSADGQGPPGAASPGGEGAEVTLQIGQLPWTEQFETEAFLVAKEIVVEGPPGLLEHIVMRQDEGSVDYSARSLGNALQQELRVKPGATVQARGHLDHWTLVAEERLTVVQRDSEVPVVVRASGNAVWRSVQTGEEKRGARLEFVGQR